MRIPSNKYLFRNGDLVIRDKHKTQWTTHALQRAVEYGFDLETLMESFRSATEIRLSKKQEIYKFKVYGMESLKNFYLWDSVEKILFTCKDDRRRDVNLIITVTKRRGNK